MRTRASRARSLPGRLVGLFAAVAAFALLAVFAPSAASARNAGDVAMTNALARATNTLVRAATPLVPRGLAAVRHYAAQLETQCPRAAAGSPQNGQSEQLDNELIGTLTTVGYHVAAAPLATFEHAVKGLHWSNPKLTSEVHKLATRLARLSTLPVPNFCGDLQTWAASHYQTVPATTLAFEHHYFAVDPEAEEVPTIVDLATPYATTGDFAVLRRVERLEVKLGEAEAAAVETYSHLIITLELQQ